MQSKFVAYPRVDPYLLEAESWFPKIVVLAEIYLTTENIELIHKFRL